MTQKLQKQFNNEDILKLNIRQETLLWKEELLFNEKEAQFYGAFLKSNMLKRYTSGTEDPKFLLQQLQHIQRENSIHLQTLLEFRKKLAGTKQSDDVQCENFYLQHYPSLKETLEKQFRNFRIIKNFIYIYLNNHNIIRIDQ